MAKEKQVLGWREWISLPELKLRNIKVKVDTGAKTSALHAKHVEILPGKKKVRFRVYPAQDSTKGKKAVVAKLKGQRRVTSSTGVSTLRPVIITPIRIGDTIRPVEITLIDRDVMGFRMLLGRQALQKLFVVDPSRSYLSGAPKRAKREQIVKKHKKLKKKIKKKKLVRKKVKIRK